MWKFACLVTIFIAYVHAKELTGKFEALDMAIPDKRPELTFTKTGKTGSILWNVDLVSGKPPISGDLKVMNSTGSIVRMFFFNDICTPEKEDTTNEAVQRLAIQTFIEGKSCPIKKGTTTKIPESSTFKFSFPGAYTGSFTGILTLNVPIGNNFKANILIAKHQITAFE